jgi:hypothetical protein
MNKLSLIKLQNFKIFTNNQIPINSVNSGILKRTDINFITHDTFIANYISDNYIFIPTGLHISLK